MDKITRLIKKEEKRQNETITLIASENYTYKEVREALGSALVNKYSEGYPAKRYYQGNDIIDKIEQRAINLAKKLFNVPHANVQSYSGSPANAAVYMALLKPGDKIMGMSLSSGGHLTHGHPGITFSGKYFKTIQYGVNEKGEIDYGSLAKLAKKEKPQIIVAGISAYSKILNWKRFAEIADSIDAVLMADVSHIAGLVVAGVHPSPAKYAHVITTTTHKTLKGPRGAIIMVTAKGLKKDSDMAKKIDRSVFPGLQGGPHDNQTAAVAIALEKAGTKSFKSYAKKIVENATTLSKALASCGFTIVGGRVENHMMLVDLRNKGLSGREAAIVLERAGIIVNANAIPGDTRPPSDPSGIRLGTPAVTSRGMGKQQMQKIANLINDILGDPQKTTKSRKEIVKLTKRFPIK